MVNSRAGGEARAGEAGPGDTQRPGETPRSRRTRAIAAGLAVTALYAGLAIWSSSITPLARGPLLDGSNPITYRWVEPPMEVETVNDPPAPFELRLRMGPEGVQSKVAVTDDNQATVIVNHGSIAPAAGAHAVTLRIDPVGPSELPDLIGDRIALGNGYRISATYEPSGAPVEELTSEIGVYLVYPQVPGVHTEGPELLRLDEAGGQADTWTPLETEISLALQQTEAQTDRLGVFMATGVPVIFPSLPPADEGGNTGAWIGTALLVLAGCALLIGVGLLLRGRNEPSQQGSDQGQ